MKKFLLIVVALCLLGCDQRNYKPSDNDKELTVSKNDKNLAYVFHEVFKENSQTEDETFQKKVAAYFDTRYKKIDDKRVEVKIAPFNYQSQNASRIFKDIYINDMSLNEGQLFYRKNNEIKFVLKKFIFNCEKQTYTTDQGVNVKPQYIFAPYDYNYKEMSYKELEPLFDRTGIFYVYDAICKNSGFELQHKQLLGKLDIKKPGKVTYIDLNQNRVIMDTNVVALENSNILISWTTEKSQQLSQMIFKCDEFKKIDQYDNEKLLTPNTVGSSMYVDACRIAGLSFKS